MRRREFIAALGAAVALRSAGARAQTAKLPTVGFLGIQTRENQEKWTTAFVQRLRELDWIEGRTVSIEYRWAEGSGDRMSEIAAEFVRLKVDVILTAGTAGTLAAKKATSIIPVVFTTVADPVGTGVVGSRRCPALSFTLSQSGPMTTRTTSHAATWLFRCATKSTPAGMWSTSIKRFFRPNAWANRS